MKKTDYLGIRIDPETKATLQAECDKLDWTLSKLAYRILQSWAEDQKGGTQSIYKFITMDNRYSDNTFNI